MNWLRCLDNFCSTEQEPDENRRLVESHYLSKRSRRQPSILTFRLKFRLRTGRTLPLFSNQMLDVLYCSSLSIGV
jgi:hypothetical protein